jgi:hypothetical protein
MIYAIAQHDGLTVQLNWNASLGKSFFTGDKELITLLRNVTIRPDIDSYKFPNDLALRRAVSSEDQGINWNWLKLYPGYPDIDNRLY